MTITIMIWPRRHPRRVCGAQQLKFNVLGKAQEINS